MAHEPPAIWLPPSVADATPAAMSLRTSPPPRPAKRGRALDCLETMRTLSFDDVFNEAPAPLLPAANEAYWVNVWSGTQTKLVAPTLETVHRFVADGDPGVGLLTFPVRVGALADAGATLFVRGDCHLHSINTYATELLGEQLRNTPLAGVVRGPVVWAASLL